MGEDADVLRELADNFALAAGNERYRAAGRLRQARQERPVDGNVEVVEGSDLAGRQSRDPPCPGAQDRWLAAEFDLDVPQCLLARVGDRQFGQHRYVVLPQRRIQRGLETGGNACTRRGGPGRVSRIDLRYGLRWRRPVIDAAVEFVLGHRSMLAVSLFQQTILRALVQ